MSGADGGCGLCRLAAGDPPPGGWVHRDATWFSCVLPGYEVPGWIVTGLRRHAEGPDGMDAAEAASFGPLVRRLAGAIRAVTAPSPERLHLVAYGEQEPHFHFLLAARPPVPDGAPVGAGHLARREELRDVDTALRTAAALRTALQEERP